MTTATSPTRADAEAAAAPPVTLTEPADYARLLLEYRRLRELSAIAWRVLDAAHRTLDTFSLYDETIDEASQADYQDLMSRIAGINRQLFDVLHPSHMYANGIPHLHVDPER